LEKLQTNLWIGVWTITRTINFLSNEDTQELAPGYLHVAFKLLFGDERSKNILTDFLKAILPDLADEEFAELTIVDPPPQTGVCGRQTGNPGCQSTHRRRKSR
jgi:hypothetical protein